jgi:hypothetical protein
MEWNRIPTREGRLKRIAAVLGLVYDIEGSPSVQQLCKGVAPDSPDEHIVICPACGQMFDCREAAQVEHHSTEKHTPKLFS